MSRALAEIAQRVSRQRELDRQGDDTNIIEYVESKWGLNLRLYPGQKVILKAHYGIPLDEKRKVVPVSDWRQTEIRYLTEADFLRYLFDDGRCNIREVVPGEERREMVLCLGRRSGKTLITACIISYETRKLIRKGNPHQYYGIAPSNAIQLTAVATTKDQAALLYQECFGHFSHCELFEAYRAHYTQSFARFQTPADIETYGRYKISETAQAHIQVTFKPCKSSGLRGANNMVIALDELAHFSAEGDASAEGVYGAIAPSRATLSPKNELGESIGDSEGRMISISSPLGKDGFFYQLYTLGFGGTSAAKKMLCLCAPTWEVNPTVKPEFYEGEYVKDPSKFMTEYGARFSDRTRGFIEDARDLYACINDQLKPVHIGRTRRPHFCGLDLGLRGDGTGISIGHLNEEGRIQVDLVDQIKAGEGKYEELETLDLDTVADWVLEFSRRFYIVEGTFDHWGGIPFEQALHKRGLKQFSMTHMTRDLHSRMFKNFKDQMYARNLALYNWPVAIDEGKINCEYIREILELQEKKEALYLIKVAAPKGKHDDMSDALVRMVWLASHNMGKGKHMASRNRPLDTARLQSIASRRQRRQGRVRRLKGGSDQRRQPSRRRIW